MSSNRLEAYLPIKIRQLPDEIVSKWANRLTFKFDRIIEHLDKTILGGYDYYTGETITPSEAYKKYIADKAYSEYSNFVNVVDEYINIPEKYYIALLNSADYYISAMRELKNKREYFDYMVNNAINVFASRSVFINSVSGHLSVGFSAPLKATYLLTKNFYVKYILEDDDILIPQFWLINIFGLNYHKYKINFYTTLARICYLVVLLKQSGLLNEKMISDINNKLKSFVLNYVTPKILPKYSLFMEILYDSEKDMYKLHIVVNVSG